MTEAVRPFERFARRQVLRQLRGLRHGQLVLVDPFAAAADRVEVLGQRDAEGAFVSAHIEVRDSRFWSDVLCRGTVGAAESYARGGWESPSVTDIVRVFVRNRDVMQAMEGGIARVFGWALRGIHALRPNTRAGSRRHIAAHYDLGNDFFERFLDPTMTYSAGIFEGPDTDLTSASVAKIDRLCRKLELRPADRLLEIGTGWGAFAIHAAEHYGCHVTTTTISRAQFEVARVRIAERGLSDRIDLRLQDYRDLEGRFDKLVSVEMIEAVGHRFLDRYMAKCSDLLADDGVAAMQIITIQDQLYRQALREVDFIKRYIFPGSFIPSVDAVSRSMTRVTDLRIANLEDMAPHYGVTLARWRANLEHNWAGLVERGYTEEFLRMWSYYLSYCEGGFVERQLGVAQVVFTKPMARLDSILPALERASPLRPTLRRVGDVREA